MTEHDAAAEVLAQQIDRLENLTFALCNLPLSDAIHVVTLREALPTIVENLKAEFAQATGTESPWT